ncbi:MAG: hypothetical protein M1814_003707 [Vezdaea aestivalis]|nr:MAG: hypothetical protein M1814_003707 [Vezdaea aestivalis]
MLSFPVLDQSEEDNLHKDRLLAVEEKPFKRITKRLQPPNAFLPNPSAPLSPPPEGSAAQSADSTESKSLALAEEREQFREAVTLDFAAFDANIVRMQLLYNANEAERDRYAAEKVRILEAAQQVRDESKLLHARLLAAQQKLAVRKGWDEQAEKITSRAMLKPREDQKLNIEKLKEEIRSLEDEGKDYTTTWGERREQFDKIVKEGLELRRQIRDEKEEVERREGMEGPDESERKDDVTMGEIGEAGDKDAEDSKEEGEEDDDDGEIAEKMDTT